MHLLELPVIIYLHFIECYFTFYLQLSLSHTGHSTPEHQSNEQLLTSSLLQNTDLLLQSHLSQYPETFQPLNGDNPFDGLRIDTNCDEDVAMDIQTFPTPTGSPNQIPIEAATGGYETPLTMSPGSTPSTTPGTTPYNTPGHTPGVTPGHTPGVTPGSSPPGPSPLQSPGNSHPSSPRSHKGHTMMMRGLASLSSPYIPITSSSGIMKDTKQVKIPRHKRPSHINAEQRRRSKIQVKCLTI